VVCLDSNVVIYLANRTITEVRFTGEALCYPSVVAIEALGYRDILASEDSAIKDLFAKMIKIPLSDAIIDTAIKLRQQKRMSLGDAIVAATALENNCELWTANTDDFEHIEDLRLVNPLH
jgi:toxin FitB